MPDEPSPTEPTEPADVGDNDGPHAPIGLGTRLGRYDLVAVLGTGGMGVVFEARDPELDRAVAVKVLSSQANATDAAARLRREGVIQARLTHPNVIRVYDVGFEAGHVFVAMELVRGGTLAEWTARAPRTIAEVIAAHVQAGRGLAAAHDAGLVHRDFKPQNVLVGDDGRVLVTDFGLARVVGDGAPDRADGTPAFMAPEQHAGTAVDARADQFSFCVALWRALSAPGQPGATVTPSTRRDGAAAPPLLAALAPGVPAIVGAALTRGLELDAERRFPSMHALLARLQPPPARTSRRWWLASVAGALVAGLVVAWLVRGGASSPPAPARWVETPVTFLGDVEAASLSVDGTQVAVYADHQILVVPAAGGEPRLLLRDVPTVPYVSWSPDGRRLLAGWVEPRPGGTAAMSYRALDVATGAPTVIDRRLGAMGRFAAADLLVSSANPWRHLQLDPVGGDGRSRTCELPGTYEFIIGVKVAGPAIYAQVTYADRRTALLATDRACSQVRVAIPPMITSELFPQPDGRVFAYVDDGGEQVLVEHGRDGKPTGRRLPVPLGTSSVVGVRPDDGVLVLRRISSWRLVEPGVTGATELARGSAEPHLELSPDRRRFAVVERRPREAAALYVVDRDQLGSRPAPLATAVGAVAWSPDGATLAAVIHGADGPSLVTIEVATGARRDLAAPRPASNGSVFWLDDHRVAYNRDDFRTYLWIDRTTGATGEAVDPEPGWVFGAAPSPAGGMLAVEWNRTPRGTWIVPPDGAPLFVRTGDEAASGHAWSPDGATLWLYDAGGRIDRFDVASRVITHVRTLELDATAAIVALFPLADGTLLVQTANAATDLVRYAPAR